MLNKIQYQYLGLGKTKVPDPRNSGSKIEETLKVFVDKRGQILVIRDGKNGIMCLDKFIESISKSKQPRPTVYDISIPSQYIPLIKA